MTFSSPLNKRGVTPAKAMVAAISGYAMDGFDLLRRAVAGRQLLGNSGIAPLPILQKILATMAKVYRHKRITITLDHDEQLSFRGEQDDLFELFGNLLDNAIEATQRSPLPHAPVEVLIKLSEQELIIEVADQGVGITPEMRDRIFERGITTKTRGDHGIGLYLIESYVTQAGGAIEVADNTPRGAIFSLFIPATGIARQLEDTDYAT